GLARQAAIQVDPCITDAAADEELRALVRSDVQHCIGHGAENLCPPVEIVERGLQWIARVKFDKGAVHLGALQSGPLVGRLAFETERAEIVTGKPREFEAEIVLGIKWVLQVEFAIEIGINVRAYVFGDHAAALETEIGLAVTRERWSGGERSACRQEYCEFPHITFLDCYPWDRCKRASRLGRSHPKDSHRPITFRSPGLEQPQLPVRIGPAELRAVELQPHRLHPGAAAG